MIYAFAEFCSTYAFLPYNHIPPEWYNKNYPIKNKSVRKKWKVHRRRLILYVDLKMLCVTRDITFFDTKKNSLRFSFQLSEIELISKNEWRPQGE